MRISFCEDIETKFQPLLQRLAELNLIDYILETQSIFTKAIQWNERRL